ncbi:hypothetical protein [Bailinhaonella thermotolerans]|uniref:CHAP domain-containing protein n=1 Tax=Bailinhaonella thermotolerans TaxID=1070861 RepID=A0A3A4BAF2_9ACTN|nr:hypothetical protein [Bailinhaonella thermotolerans]RJL35899.1 hypothetical protein D5H75_03780 [Bailinhaonella thermotolerans]
MRRIFRTTVAASAFAAVLGGMGAAPASASATHRPASAPAPASASAVAAKAKGAVFCECGIYAVRKLKLKGAIPRFAKDFGPFLKKNGFRYIGRGVYPQPGDVAIWREGLTGHIAISHFTTQRGTFKGSNQGGSKFTEAGCNNVSVTKRSYGTAYIYRK